MSSLITDGIKSSEFWILIIIAVAGLVMTLTNHLDADTYWQFLAGIGGVYAVSRGLAKTETS